MFLGHGAAGIGQLDVCFKWMVLLVGNKMMGEDWRLAFWTLLQIFSMELLAGADFEKVFI